AHDLPIRPVGRQRRGALEAAAVIRADGFGRPGAGAVLRPNSSLAASSGRWAINSARCAASRAAVSCARETPEENQTAKTNPEKAPAHMPLPPPPSPHRGEREKRAPSPSPRLWGEGGTRVAGG